MRFLPVFVIFISTSLLGQNLNQVKSDLEVLASKKFSGRGYMNKGTQKAATFIQNRLSEIGVKEVTTQPFGVKVNTFPKKSSLRLGTKKFKEGEEYIFDPKSRSFRGEGQVRVIGFEEIMNKSSINLEMNVIPIIDADLFTSPDEASRLDQFVKSRTKETPVLLIKDKLTWSVASAQNMMPLIHILRNAIPEELEGQRFQLKVEAEEKELVVENIIAKIPGRRRDSLVVFTAHYDHIGKMGKAIFPGASDNGTGTSMVLDLTSYFAENQPVYDTYFIFFAAEEAGLRGSKFFVDNPELELNKIKFLTNLDLMGSAAKGITVVNGKLYRDEMNRMAEINKNLDLVPKIKLRGNAPNSDHYWFSEYGVPAIFIYTEGNITAYHDVADTSENVDWTNYEEVFTLIVEFTKTL